MSLPLAAKGEFARVKANMESALDKSGQPVRRGTMAHDHHVYMLLTEAAAAQRDAAGLAVYGPRLAELAERDGHRLYQAVAARAQGVASRLAGDLSAAATHLERAIDIFTALGTGWQIGRTYMECAELARALNEVAAARDFLARAISAFEIQKAVPDLERARAAWADLKSVLESGA
jgi:hypothetical protein